MANLRKFTLDHNERTRRWELTDDRSNRVVKTFATKGAATAGGALRRAVGSDGGSVKIQKQNGRFQEERTYPRSRDPRRSRG
jgi:Uncharacterized protein conserved in bacteria (DUF2188)